MIATSISRLFALLARKLSGSGFGSRFAVILSGELVQALFHFVLNIVLVRMLSQQDYGLFAMVFVCGAVGITYIRAVVAVPATLFIARSFGRPGARAYDSVFGTGALAMSLGLGLVAAAALFPVMGAGSLAAGGFIGLYMFRSYLRIVLLARKAPRVAGLSDLAYAGVGIIALLGSVYGLPAISLDHAFLALALGHGCGIAISYIALREPLRLTIRPTLWRRYRAMWRTLAWSLTGVTTNTLQGQGMTLAFALLVGPAAFAPIAATLVLFAPLRIPTNALTNMVLAEVTELLAKGQAARANRIVVRSTAVIAVGCVLYGAAMLVALPMIELHLFKGRFDHEPMNWIAAGVWLAMLVSLLYAIPRAYLEACGAFRTIAWGSATAFVIGACIMIPVLLTLPSAFALLGLIASEAFIVLWLGRAFQQAAAGNDSSARSGLAGAPLAGAALQGRAG